jgi:hypothetical protein
MTTVVAYMSMVHFGGPGGDGWAAQQISGRD